MPLWNLSRTRTCDKNSPKMNPDENIVVNVSGRGEKDLFIVARAVDKENWIEFLKKEVIS